MTTLPMTGVAIAAAVQAREASVAEIIRGTLARIRAVDARVNSFTHVAEDRALTRARDLDACIARGEEPGVLAGVPFAVKNLFDLQGIPTLAGSKINASDPPATADATLVQRLEAAGAVLVGALSMGEYAYDFTGRNEHYGPCRNPHDLDRMTGGSSSGAGAAVGGGLVPLALGSDTNGSIRVPASLCGTFGLKPTYGRLSRGGTLPFVDSLDHVGPLARSVADLALSFDAMQGADPRDRACTDRAPEPTADTLDRGIDGVRIAVADGYFAQGAAPQALEAVATVARALGTSRTVTIPGAARARAAAFLITSTEGASLHAERIRTRIADYDSETRPRFLAGALVPGDWYVQAQRFRTAFREQMRAIFEGVDIILAPSTPVTAPRIDQVTMTLDGVEMPIRPHLGIYTQPFSFIGLPVCSVPVWNGPMPIGVQVIGAPWTEGTVLQVARAIETEGIAEARIAAL